MSDATSVDPTCCLRCCPTRRRCCSAWRTSSRPRASTDRDRQRSKVIIEQTAREGPCPACGVLSSAVKDRPVSAGQGPAGVGSDRSSCGGANAGWCAARRCVRGGRSPRPAAAVRPRGRVTERLRDKVATAIAGSNRAVSEVAAEYGVSWPTAHRALVAAAARWLPEPEPTSRLGIDETRFRSVRWILDGITWKRSDPWLTSFVDCSPDGPGSLLGLAPGRTGGCVRDWLAEQTAAFRHAIEIVVIDPSAPYASGIRAALPDAKIAVDKWHLVALANTMVTEVRQRVTRDLLGRRGTVARPGLGEPAAAAHRRRPPVDQAVATAHRDARPLRPDQGDRRRLGGEGTAPAAARRARASRRSGGGWPTSTRPRSTPSCPKRPGSPAPSRPGGRPSWSPSPTTSSNARTEGFNRIIKQVKRVGCGYRNMINYQRRILSHIAVTRPQRSAA